MGEVVPTIFLYSIIEFNAGKVGSIDALGRCFNVPIIAVAIF